MDARRAATNPGRAMGRFVRVDAENVGAAIARFNGKWTFPEGLDIQVRRIDLRKKLRQ